MTPERRMWQVLRKAVGPSWHAVRHENQFGLGISDISFAAEYVQGWIELKFLDKWPVLKDTIVRIPNKNRFKIQTTWLHIRGLYGGGHCWLLLKIGQEWLLFDHIQVVNVGYLNQESLRACAKKIWPHTPPKTEFIEAITS